VWSFFPVHRHRHLYELLIGLFVMPHRVEGSIPCGQRSLSAVGAHAIGLNSWTGTEGSPVSSLKCDRWQRLNLESRLAAVCAASGHWCSKPRGCVMALGPWPAGWPACYQLAWRAYGGRVGLPDSCVAWRKRNKAGLKLCALLNTVQGSPLPTYHAHTHTHTSRRHLDNKECVAIDAVGTVPPL